MDYEISMHARQELVRRGIPLSVVESVLNHPGQKVPECEGVICCQSVIAINDKPCLVRVMINENSVPVRVITVYRTSRIGKYWKAEE